ncbi:hypothetical protein MAR_038413 [Mya arenaria]|uniref:LRAT domain-containing protein n=1 Tax=Mya arenaria TaxID=6604 RepID=A0ABY7FUA3_MYAAR|nr:hypothetical protein MAR_038413 [Mya arenaria]
MKIEEQNQDTDDNADQLIKIHLMIRLQELKSSENVQNVSKPCPFLHIMKLMLAIILLFMEDCMITTRFNKYTTVKTLDFAHERINVVVYQNRKFTKAEVACRAREYYQHQKGTRDFNYNVLRNNCEHLRRNALPPFRVQVVKVRMVVKLFLSRGFMGISDERMRNTKLFEKNFICSNCNEMNTRLLSVSVEQIWSADDVKGGDVIRYTYYLLHHEAVVLETNGVDKTSVKVSIAHYAFRGFFKYKKIIEEAITIRFDGSCSVLQYRPPQYEVFPPEKFVERA